MEQIQGQIEIIQKKIENKSMHNTDSADDEVENKMELKPAIAKT